MHSEYEIFGMSQQLKKIMERACEYLMDTYHLRMVELDILSYIAHAGKRNTAKDILGSSHISKAHISKSVENLRQRGYIMLSEDEEDRRCLHISITPEGMPVIAEYDKVRGRVLQKMFSGVTEEERQCMKRVLQKMTDNLNCELDNYGL